jgi:Spy/CpxP family protein refolding chaperone
MKHRTAPLTTLLLLLTVSLKAQGPPERLAAKSNDDRSPGPRHPPPSHKSPEASGYPSLRLAPSGKWWVRPGLIERLSLTNDQQKRIEDLFQQSRLKLIDLSATLQRGEAILEPLLAAEKPDESKTLRQIELVAQARAELEKANARMLFGFRQVLSAEQWRKLQIEASSRP